MNKTYVNWVYQTADSADDKIEAHKDWCVVCPSIRSTGTLPPLSAPDKGAAGSGVFCDGPLTGNVCVRVCVRGAWIGMYLT